MISLGHVNIKMNDFEPYFLNEIEEVLEKCKVINRDKVQNWAID